MALCSLFLNRELNLYYQIFASPSSRNPFRSATAIAHIHPQHHVHRQQSRYGCTLYWHHCWRPRARHRHRHRRNLPTMHLWGISSSNISLKMWNTCAYNISSLDMVFPGLLLIFRYSTQQLLTGGINPVSLFPFDVHRQFPSLLFVVFLLASSGLSLNDHFCNSFCVIYSKILVRKNLK